MTPTAICQADIEPATMYLFECCLQLKTLLCINGAFHVEYDVIKNYEGEYDEKINDFKTDIIIPNDWLGLKTKRYESYKLGFGLFKDYKCIKKVTIPECISEIGAECFFNCLELEHLNISDSVVSIGERAFANCVKISNILLPQKLEILNDEVFANCRSLSCIPNGVEIISDRCFNNTSVKEKIIIPSTIKSIASTTFKNFNGIIKFNGTSKELDKIEIDSSLRSIISTNDSFSF